MIPRVAILPVFAAIVGLPLLGAAAAGRSLAAVFQFPPPLQIPTDFPRWSGWACGLVLLPFVAIASSWAAARRGGEPPAAMAEPCYPAVGRFPAWGWAAVAWTLAWWVLAWTRFDWFAPLQRYTFFPLWLGFVVTVNALTLRAAGHCLLQRAPRTWLALFAVSALFWWMFEWLNRFVGNWHYLAVEDFGARAYAVHATLCFSTVLPAVAAVAEWLGCDARLRRRLAHGPRWAWFSHRATGWLLLAVATAGLLLTGMRPWEAYPALWSAPLALAIAAGVLGGRRGVWTEIAAGDWQRAATWALAALVCGFFWEMWNVHSVAKWIYTVPYVDRWHLFEMPALGYLGYLPFGLECLVVVDTIRGRYPEQASAVTPPPHRAADFV